MDKAAWRNDVKEGDIVDAVMEEKNFNCSGWAEARVAGVNGDELYLEFINDKPGNDRFIDRFSIELGIHKSRTEEAAEWRESLKAS